MRVAAALACFYCLTYSVAQPAPADQCSALARTAIPNSRIVEAERIADGQFDPPSGKPLPNLPAFCRIAIVSKPEPGSNNQYRGLAS